MIETRFVEIPRQGDNFLRVNSSGSMYLVLGMKNTQVAQGTVGYLTADWDSPSYGQAMGMTYVVQEAAQPKPLQAVFSSVTKELLIDDPRIHREPISVSSSGDVRLRFEPPPPPPPLPPPDPLGPTGGDRGGGGVAEAFRQMLGGLSLPNRPAEKPGLPAGGCPPGFQELEQSNGRWTCFHVESVKRPLDIVAPLSLQIASPPIQEKPVIANPYGGWAYSGQSPFDVGGAIATIGGAGCASISNPTAKAVCLAAATYAAGQFGGGGDTRGQSLGSGTTFQADQNGKKQPGVKGWLERALPGGKSGYAWGPAGGMAAVEPLRVNQTVLRCPPRFALGIDNVCYPKFMLPRNARKWKPERRPLLSAMDAKILTRAKSVQKKLRKVAGKHAARARPCPPGARRKK